MAAPKKKIIDYRGHNTPPYYATHGAVGIDLTANITDDIVLHPGARRLIPTGLWLNLSAGMEMQVRPRSGLALGKGVTVLNSPGTIDPDYEEEVNVLLINHGRDIFVITNGMKIAQGVFAAVYHVLEGYTDQTKDRTGGFGSTDKPVSDAPHR